MIYKALALIVSFIILNTIHPAVSNIPIRIPGDNDAELTSILTELFKKVPSLQSGTKQLKFEDKMIITYGGMPHILRPKISWPTRILTKPLDSSAMENVAVTSRAGTAHT